MDVEKPHWDGGEAAPKALNTFIFTSKAVLLQLLLNKKRLKNSNIWNLTSYFAE